MITKRFNLKRAVAAFCASMVFCAAFPAFSADQALIDDLLAELSASTPEAAPAIENQIRAEWAKSGSASMDLLLERGRNALNDGNPGTALEHFTALTDHAPEFAQGWNYRATALFQLEMYGPAIDAIEKTLRLNPQHFDAMTGLAIILDELGYEKDALEAYQAVQAIHPHRENISTAIERLEQIVRGQEI